MAYGDDVTESIERPHQVAIVVDPNFGIRLIELSRRVHVWACNSPQNREAVDQVWATTLVASIDHGITTFETLAGATPEESCEAVLESVELHHGEFSHHPPWSILEVFGAELSPALEASLRELGFVRFEREPLHFTAFRSEQGVG